MASSSGWTSWYCGTLKRGLLPSRRRSTTQEAAEANTTEPSTGAWRSPTISSRANLDRRPLAAQRDSAGQRCRGAKELSQHGAQRDAAFAGEQRSLGLRHPAASRVREIAEQQVADDQRTHDREQYPSPPIATWRIQAHPGSFRQQDESDNGQARQRADHQRQHQKNLVLTLLQLGREM